MAKRTQRNKTNKNNNFAARFSQWFSKQPMAVRVAIITGILPAAIAAISAVCVAILQIFLTPNPTHSLPTVISISSSTPSPTFSSTPSATHTLVPTSSVTPTIAETLTHTPTPTVIPILNYAIQDCINADIWAFDNIENPPRDKSKPNCLDLRKWNFEALKRDPPLDERQGLRINIEASEATTKGIYFDFSDQRELLRLRLLVEIDELTVNKPCKPGQLCDADLVIGFGETLTNGWFLIFRAVNVDSNRLGCFLPTVKEYCSPQVINEPPSDRMQEYELRFTVNGPDVSATIDDVPVKDTPSLAENQRKFWIGYNFRRSSGSLKVFIEFLDPAK